MMPIIPAPVQSDYALRALHTLTYGTMPASRLRGLVCRNTLKQPVQSPTVSGLLSCPNFQAGRYLCAAGLGGFGQGAPVRKAGGASCFALRTPCPPFVRNARKRGFLSQSGTQTMTQATFTPAPVNAKALTIDAVVETVDRLIKQMESPSSIPQGLLRPLVQAVQAKEEQAKTAKAEQAQHEAQTFALPADKSEEARLRKVSDLAPLPYEWSGAAGASLMLQAQETILHNSAAGFEEESYIQALIDDADTVMGTCGAVADGQRGAAVTVLSAIAQLAAAMLKTEQGLELMLTLQAESLACAEEWAQQEQAELKAKAMLRPAGGGI